MDYFWTAALLLVLITGLLCPLTNGLFLTAVYWGCEWVEGNDINWGYDTICLLAPPFIWLFAMFELILLYHH